MCRVPKGSWGNCDPFHQRRFLHSSCFGRWTAHTRAGPTRSSFKVKLPSSRAEIWSKMLVQLSAQDCNKGQGLGFLRVSGTGIGAEGRACFSASTVLAPQPRHLMRMIISEPAKTSL